MTEGLNSLSDALSAAVAKAREASGQSGLANLVSPPISPRDKKFAEWCVVPNPMGGFNTLARTSLAREMYRHDRTLGDRALAVIEIGETLTKCSSDVAHEKYSKELYKLNLSIWANWFKGFIKSPLTILPPPCLEAAFTEGLLREIGIDSRFATMFRHQLRSAQANPDSSKDQQPKKINYRAKIEPFYDQRTGFVGAQVTYPWELAREERRANLPIRIAMGVSHTRETISKDIIVPAPKSPLDHQSIIFSEPPFPSRMLKLDPSIHEPVRLKKVHNGPGEMAMLLLGFQACMRLASLRNVALYKRNGEDTGRFCFVSRSILTGRHEEERDAQRVRRASQTEDVSIPIATMRRYSEVKGEHFVIIPLSRSFAQLLLKEGVGFGHSFKALHQFFPTDGSTTYSGESWRQGGLPTMLDTIKHVTNVSVRPVNGAPHLHLLEAFEERQVDKLSPQVKNALNVRLVRWMYGLDPEAIGLQSQCSVHHVKRDTIARGEVLSECGFTFAGRFLRSAKNFPKGEYFIMPLPWKDAATEKQQLGKGVLLAIPIMSDRQKVAEDDCFVILRQTPPSSATAKKVRHPRDLRMAPFAEYRSRLQTDRIDL
jgi:hypothetical protein